VILSRTALPRPQRLRGSPGRRSLGGKRFLCLMQVNMNARAPVFRAAGRGYTEIGPVSTAEAVASPGNALLSGNHRREALPLPVASRLACCGSSVLE
jgi:hypothetical protein